MRSGKCHASLARVYRLVDEARLADDLAAPPELAVAVLQYGDVLHPAAPIAAQHLAAAGARRRRVAAATARPRQAERPLALAVVGRSVRVDEALGVRHLRPRSVGPRSRIARRRRQQGRRGENELVAVIVGNGHLACRVVGLS